jgi:maltose alpha-D-glucosyltransferase/alpha-amylase
MQWSSGRNAGFSTASSARLIRRPISKGKFNYRRVNVEAEANAPASFLNWMKHLIATRRKCPEWGWGNLRILDAGEPGILSHCSEYKGAVLVAAHNLTGKACAVRLALNAPLQGRLVPVLGNNTAVAHAGEFRLRLGPYGYAWYRLLRDDASSL